MGQNELQGGSGVNLILSKRFKIAGAAAPFMASELFPMIGLEIDRPEWGFLGGTRLGAGTVGQAGVVAEFAQAGLLNPTGSGAIIVCVMIGFRVTSPVPTVQVRVGFNPTTDAETSGTNRDLRWGEANANTIARLFVRSAAALDGRVIYNGSGPADQKNFYSQAIVLPPGAFVQANRDVLNEDIVASFSWYERAAEPGELQGAASS